MQSLAGLCCCCCLNRARKRGRRPQSSRSSGPFSALGQEAENTSGAGLSYVAAGLAGQRSPGQAKQEDQQQQAGGAGSSRRVGRKPSLEMAWRIACTAAIPLAGTGCPPEKMISVLKKNATKYDGRQFSAPLPSLTPL